MRWRVVQFFPNRLTRSQSFENNHDDQIRFKSNSRIPRPSITEMPRYVGLYCTHVINHQLLILSSGRELTAKEHQVKELRSNRMANKSNGIPPLPPPPNVKLYCFVFLNTRWKHTGMFNLIVFLLLCILFFFVLLQRRRRRRKGKPWKKVSFVPK